MKTSKKFLLLIAGLFVAVAAPALLLNRLVLASKTIAYGCFHQVAHKGSGCVALIQKADGQTVLQLMDFETTEKEDLHVLLISAPDALENETVKDSAQLYVAPLRRSFEGSQQYVVPPGQDLAKFKAVVIWHGKHGVNFTTAPLKRLGF
jgi:hypothetical protein